MKQALILLQEGLTSKGLDGKIVANIHDEWQIECSANDADEVGKLGVWAIEEAGRLLNSVCVPGVRGFSVNVSNFRTTQESVSWAERVGEYTSYNYFVVDTSRNGNGPYGNEWCNPPGRAIGLPPTTDTDHPLCDAYLWIKIPGESDGRKNNGPRAGRFWPVYAEQLVLNTKWIN
jgi:endoglucanase